MPALILLSLLPIGLVAWWVVRRLGKRWPKWILIGLGITIVSIMVQIVILVPIYAWIKPLAKVDLYFSAFIEEFARCGAILLLGWKLSDRRKVDLALSVGLIDGLFELAEYFHRAYFLAMRELSGNAYHDAGGHTWMNHIPEHGLGFAIMTAIILFGRVSIHVLLAGNIIKGVVTKRYEVAIAALLTHQAFNMLVQFKILSPFDQKDVGLFFGMVVASLVLLSFLWLSMPPLAAKPAPR